MIPENELSPIFRKLLQEGEHAISILKNTTSHSIYYLITNLRVINCTNKKNVQSYYYASVYNIEVRHDTSIANILLHTQPILDPSKRQDDLNHTIILGNVLNPYQSKKIIEAAWFDKSPFGIRQDNYKKLAKKYGLNFLPIVSRGNKIIQLTGSINGMPISFQINNVLRFGKMQIRISVPNPENNFLSIQREKPSDAISKLFGKQDIITHSKAFDKRFLLQSDYQKFFDFIITKEIKTQLMATSSFIEGSIFFGLKKEKEKTKKKNTDTEFDILDEHLLDELLPEIELDDSLVSPLVFECENVRKNLSNVDIMIAHSIATFEVILDMANRMKEYTDK